MKLMQHFCLHLFLGLVTTFSIAQSTDPNAKISAASMVGNEHNFSSFKPASEVANIADWKRLNDPTFYAHPEFGKLNDLAPCSNCVEDLSKRKEAYRYFIDLKNPSVFYEQHAYGPINYFNGTYFLAIDQRLKQLSPTQFETKSGFVKVGFDTEKATSYVYIGDEKLYFNQLSLWGETAGENIQLATANWSGVTAGEDGLFIQNIFPGIDAYMVISRGAIKTSYIVNQNNFSGYLTLKIKDELEFTSSLKLEDKVQTEERLFVYANQSKIVEIEKAFAYPLEDKSNVTDLAYEISDQSFAIVIPVNWLDQLLQSSKVLIDPTVTSTASLAQATILGSMYNGSCNFTNSCDYTLNVPTPINATITDLTVNFTYKAPVFTLCYLSDGGTRFSIGSCVSPSAVGYYYFCPNAQWGTCAMTNISLFSELSACIPAASCVSQNIPVALKFYRSCYGSVGCNGACIGADSPFIVTLTGKTVEFTSPTNSITGVSTICQGLSSTFSTSGAFGVGPYTYNWSFSATGTPSLGTTASQSITFPNSGSQTIYLTITDACGNSQTASKVVTVTTSATPTFTQVAAICVGGTFTLPTTSTNAITGTWSPAINTASTTTYTFTPTAGQCAPTTTMTVTVNPSVTPTFTQVAAICSGGTFTLPTTSTNAITGTWSPAVNTTTTTTYTFTPTAGQCATTATMTVTVNPSVTPTFTQLAAICSGGTFTLPTTSNNAITGTWSPAINTTSTTTYTFTPTAGQCASTATMTVTVNPSLTPTFTQVAAICSGGTFTLPTTSNNAITGTWSPAINTATTTTYTFTPTSGQCATTATMTVTVNSSVTPTFTQVAAICSGGTFTLPTTSTNTITGTWSPAINTATTTTYTFTPTVGQCATTATMTVTVNPSVTPTFTQVAAICAGGTFTLPTTSTNAITGTWSPAINTASTTTYTFTPTAGQCASPETMTVTVNPSVTPTFTQVAAICSGGTFTLPTTSNNAITGTWSPAINTASTTTYTFTPTAGQCASTATMTVTVNPSITPTFTQVAGICVGGTFTLPTTSTNAITGTWSPAINTATTTTYTFTPTAGQCASTATMTVSVNSSITPTFTQVAAICTGGSFTLPTTSSNAITGTWSPAVNTTTTTTYTFTPTAGQCANTTTMTVAVNSLPVVTTIKTDITCNGLTNGTIQVNVANVTGTNTFVWTPAVGTSAIVAGLSVGSYSVVVTNANGCSAAAVSTTITAPSALTVALSNTPTGCSTSTGSATVTATGGTAPYSYAWTPNVGSTNSVSSLAAGTYSVVVTDAKNCTATGSTTITVPQSPTLNLTVSQPISCFGLTDASVASTVSGGTTPYTYAWSNGASTATATNVGVGIYTLTLTDALGCSVVASITVANPQQIQVDFTSDVASCGQADGSITVNAAGGTSPYTYLWNDGAVTATISNKVAGNYTIDVKDANGCTVNATYALQQTGGLNIQINPIDPTIYEDETVNLNATLSPYEPGTIYTWDPPTNSSCTNCPNPTVGPDATTTYTVYVQTPSGCLDSLSTTVYVKMRCGEVLVPSIFSPNGDNKNDFFIVQGRCIQSYNVKIYNRWGELLYQQDKETLGWDGTFKGKELNSDSFSYVVDISFNDGSFSTMRGSVALVK